MERGNSRQDAALATTHGAVGMMPVPGPTARFIIREGEAPAEPDASVGIRFQFSLPHFRLIFAIGARQMALIREYDLPRHQKQGTRIEEGAFVTQWLSLLTARKQTSGKGRAG